MLVDALNYSRQSLASEMLGARRSKRQGDIGKFDVVAAGDGDHQRRWRNRRGAPIESNGGYTGYLKSVRHPRDSRIRQSDMMSMCAPGVGIEIPAIFRQDPTIRQFHVQGGSKTRLA